MTNRRNVILIGGIHGVGKSTICKNLCSDLGLEYLSASKLISDYKDKRSMEALDVGKLVKDIAENQDILLRAIQEYLDKDKKYLMDGHFTLLDASSNVQTIPASTFEDLPLVGIVVLTDEPTSIRQRLSSRDDKECNLNLLKSMQSRELTHAADVSRMLKIKASVLSIDNYDSIKQIALDLLKLTSTTTIWARRDGST